MGFPTKKKQIKITGNPNMKFLFFINSTNFNPEID